MLNYIKVAGNSSVEQVNELQVALITEQQSVHALKEKIKLDRENDLKNQQIIQVRALLDMLTQDTFFLFLYFILLSFAIYLHNIVHILHCTLRVKTDIV